jgi:hypothetical protein
MFHFKGKPTNAEEQAIWDWWFAMDKRDPDFQWKTPIEFYGKVIDQHGEAVVGATVNLQWSALGSTPKKTLTTDAGGSFEITGISGKGLSVDVSALGYRRRKSASGSYEYSAFDHLTFHVPEKSNPVIFELWRLEDAEPLYFWATHKRLTTNGEKVWFDLSSGKFASSGDFAFSTMRGETHAPRQFDYTLTVEAAPGGGLVLRNEELMFEAPEQGYEPSWTVEQFGKDSSFSMTQKFRFYLKTASEKYAAVQVEYAQFPDRTAEIRAFIYFNPSGSRNLQYDSKKRINKNQ